MVYPGVDPGAGTVNIINDLDDGTQYTLSKFADINQREADTQDGCTATQRAGEMGRGESHGIQETEMRSPACGEE